MQYCDRKANAKGPKPRPWGTTHPFHIFNEQLFLPRRSGNELPRAYQFLLLCGPEPGLCCPKTRRRESWGTKRWSINPTLSILLNSRYLLLPCTTPVRTKRPVVEDCPRKNGMYWVKSIALHKQRVPNAPGRRVAVEGAPVEVGLFDGNQAEVCSSQALT